MQKETTIQLTPMPTVLLEGDGVAAVCVARLLADAGAGCIRQPNPRPKLAAILLGEQTQQLLREIFPASQQYPADLFDGFHRLQRRFVLWGETAESLDLPHSGVVAPEAELLRRLWERVPPAQAVQVAPQDETLWRIQTSRIDAASRPEHNVGGRTASFALVELREESRQDACWVESVANGWLFLLALGRGQATLIGVGDAPKSLLDGSRLVALQVARVVTQSTPVPAHPRLTSTLADRGFVACGSAAMSFDPLCGEGAGNAVREAYLAAAVVRAAAGGFDSERLAEHYTDRLQRGFLRHLQACLQFYATGGSGSFWKAEAASLRLGIQDVQRLVEAAPRIEFKLIGRDLVPVQA